MDIAESEEMKIQIQIDDKVQEDEIIIRCRELTDDIKDIQTLIKNKLSESLNLSFFKEDKEFYIPIKDILFFQTEDNGVFAHTKKDMYEVKYKLYELEAMLPKNFMRVSKSSILNIDYIYSITRSLTSSSVVEFENTFKKVYVSRHYFKELKDGLLRRKNL